MSKFILIFALLLTFALAEDKEEFPFIGITVSTESISLGSAGDDQSVTTFGLQYGKQTTDWRTMFGYSFAKDGYTSFGIEIDKILLDNTFGLAEIRPFLGLAVGGIFYDNDQLEKDSGFYYGANLGLLVYTTDNIDADISYHYYKVDGFDEFENFNGATLSLHYFY